MSAVDSSTRIIPAADLPDEGAREVTNGSLRLEDPLDDVVKELFGSSEFGRCFGEFGCSHSLIRGRLYATSEAILFYSNVLGFEKRIFLFYQDIIEMDLFRTTSICITTGEGETYVFKSFEKRKEVLRLLKSLEMMAATNRAAAAATTPVANRRRAQITENLYGEDAFSTPTNGARTAAAAAVAGYPQESQSITAVAAAPSSSVSQSTNTATTPSSSILKRTVSYKNLAMPVLGNRRRAISDSVMSSIELFEDIAEAPSDANNAVVLKSSSSSSSPPSQPSRSQSTQDALLLSIGSSEQLTWDQVKARGRLQDQAIEVSTIDCGFKQSSCIF